MDENNSDRHYVQGIWHGILIACVDMTKDSQLNLFEDADGSTVLVYRVPQGFPEITEELREQLEADITDRLIAEVQEEDQTEGF